MARFKAIDKRVHELCNFDFNVMVDYPHKMREHELPIVACKMKKLAEFDQIQRDIAEHFGVVDEEHHYHLQ